jgi:hypothetical protein
MEGKEWFDLIHPCCREEIKNNHEEMLPIETDFCCKKRTMGLSNNLIFEFTHSFSFHENDSMYRITFFLN